MSARRAIDCKFIDLDKLPVEVLVQILNQQINEARGSLEKKSKICIAEDERRKKRAKE
jgi:hypothetical protein